jgi:hypothetical protein
VAVYIFDKIRSLNFPNEFEMPLLALSKPNELSAHVAISKMHGNYNYHRKFDNFSCTLKNKGGKERPVSILIMSFT